MKKINKLISSSLAAVMLSSMTIPYLNSVAANTNNVTVPTNCVLKADKVLLNVSNPKINGDISETQDLPEINLEIMDLLNDEINKVIIDSDEDGIPDAYEVLVGTDPNNKDTDGVQFTDGYV